MENSSISSRIQNLDLLRAFAILMVIYFHTVQMWFGSYISDKAIFNLGKYGVNVFFILSGFLIARIFLKNKNLSVFKFWAGRFLRIYPPYLIILILSWLAAYFNSKKAFDWGYMIMIQNFYSTIPYFLVSWSLCIEEHFYLLFTVVILFFSKVNHHICFWALLCVIPCILRYLSYGQGSETFGYYQTATYFQVDSIAFGVLAAYLVPKKQYTLRNRSSVILSGFIAVVILSYFLVRYDNIFNHSFGQTFLNILITVLMLLLYFSKSLGISKLSFTKLNALMAYSIYLVHPLCIHVVIIVSKNLRLQNLSLSYLFTLLMIYLVAYCFYKIVERPAIQLRSLLLVNG
jgi:peptidoglycan/LPS O-acetylase OafA/YrhL